MLLGLFDRTADECDIEIVFRPNEEEEQQNDCRDLLVAYVEDRSIPNGRRIAHCLQSVTTLRSGLGLLFLMKGKAEDDHKLVLARFPADQGVIAEEHAQQLIVQFIERVFMNSAKAYKSAIYISDSADRGFWDGKAVGRQITGPVII